MPNNTVSKHTIVERVPYNIDAEPARICAPTWRLISYEPVQRSDGSWFESIANVLESDRLSVALSYTPWAIVPFVAEVERAIKALGRKNVDGTRATIKFESPKFKLVLTSKGITASTWEGEEQFWGYGSGGWVVAKAAPTEVAL